MCYRCAYLDGRDDVVEPMAANMPKPFDGRPFGPRHPLGNPKEVAGFLDQGERWVGQAGPMDIDAMDAAHALNAANFMLVRATQICLTLQAAEPWAHYESQIASGDQARRLVVTRPLFEALMRRAAVPDPTPPPSWAR